MSHHGADHHAFADGALVLLSGGQDSSTCLAWALERFAKIETIGFEYGQRHRIELDCRARVRDGMRRMRPDWDTRLGLDHTIGLGALGEIADTALTGEREIALRKDGLPNTFVPGRNIIFLAFAAALADRRGLRHIVGGMCETDYSGYPDCRDDTIKALQVALNLGMAQRLVLHTPLMWIDKAATWRMAEALGGGALVDLLVEETHSCYRGDRTHRHEWGYGCGACPACELRRTGWQAYRGPRAAMQFRAAVPEDAAMVRDLVRAAYAKWVPVIGREPRPMTADYDRALREHEIEFLSVDGAIAGLIETMLHPDHLWIENVAVRPESQGHGIGRRLLAHAERKAAEAGRAELRLLTNAAFTPNVALYSRLGYRVERTDEWAGGLTLYMRKRL